MLLRLQFESKQSPFLTAYGRLLLLVTLKFELHVYLLTDCKLTFRKQKFIYPIVSKLCTTTCHLPAFTSIYWHIEKGQTP